MTNEEKAREIADYYTDTNDIGVALNSAKEMAEWKNHQFKEYMEKKRNELAAISEKDFYDISNAFGGVKYLNEIINELFDN